MLDGFEDFQDKRNNRFESNDRYDWSYGDYSRSSARSYQDWDITKKSSASSNGYAFRSADSFLANLNKLSLNFDKNFNLYQILN